MRKAAASPVQTVTCAAAVERNLAAVSRAQQRLCPAPLPLQGARLHCPAAAAAVTGLAAVGTTAATNAAANATVAAAAADAATAAAAAATDAAPTATVAG